MYRLMKISEILDKTKKVPGDIIEFGIGMEIIYSQLKKWLIITI